MDVRLGNSSIHGVEQNTLPVFLQDWWLEAAQNAIKNPCREVRVVRDDRTVGYLTYTLKRNRLGIRSWEPLDWCRVNEPILSPTLSGTEKYLVMREMLQHLPRDISFEFVCSPAAPDLPVITQAAAEAGFGQRLETIFWQLPEASINVMQRVTKKYRQGIRKADEELCIIALNATQFVKLYDANLRAANRRPYSDSNVARALIDAGLNRSQPQARVLAAHKRNNPSMIDAAIACVWDSQRYYYWMTTCSRFHNDDRGQKAHTHAVKLLLVNAIQDAGARGLIFDTDGGDSEGAAKQFVALKFERQAQRVVFTRHSLPLRLYNQLRPAVKSAAARLGYQL